MNILIVGSVYQRLKDLLEPLHFDTVLLTSAKVANGASQIRHSNCDLCFVTFAELDDDLLSAAQATSVPVVLLVDDEAQLAEINASDDRELPPDILLLSSLTPSALTLAIRSVMRHAKARRRACDTNILFESTQEAVGVGTWDWDVSSGRVTWSENLYRLFGLTPVIASEKLFQAWHDAIHPEDQAAAMSAATAAMAGDASLSSLFRIRKGNAEPTSEDWRWISCKGRVLRDGSGAVARVIGVNVDVTAHIQQEQALLADRHAVEIDLLQSESRFRAYFDASSDCKFHLNVEEDGRFTYVDVNAAGLTAMGLTLDQVIGQEPLKLMGPEKGAEMTEGLHKVLRTGGPFRYEPKWEMETGTIIYDAVYMPLRDRSGVITGILGAARDVTEARRTEAALFQAQKVEAIGQLAAGVAHDFNNILSSFQACLRLIEKEITSERGKMVVAEGHAATDRGKALTEWLTRFIRKAPLALSDVDVNAALEQMSEMLRQALPPKIILKQELASDLDLARADTHEIALAVLNLAVNARDAMPKGGTFQISTRNEIVSQEQPDGIGRGRYVVLEIEDTGSGMSPETLARALEPFFTTKPVGGGTGLGLSMVYGILRRAGGGLRIASHEGQGTRVSLFFPAAARSAQQPANQVCQNA